MNLFRNIFTTKILVDMDLIKSFCYCLKRKTIFPSYGVVFKIAMLDTFLIGYHQEGPFKDSLAKHYPMHVSSY